jgi:flavin-dependent dehydrogenase
MVTQFKVVIIGGSIAGLSLARILEIYSIDYVLLEKHAKITTQLGC